LLLWRPSERFPSSVSDFIFCIVGTTLDFFLFPAELIMTIESVVPQIAPLLKDNDPDVCDSAEKLLGEISKQCK
jgi:hypothetical protein